MRELLGINVKKEILTRINKIVENHPKLTFYILVNEKEISALTYAKMIEKTVSSINLNAKIIFINSFIQAKEEIDKINKLKDSTIILSRPLKVENENKLMEMIDPKKDPDMLTSANLGHLLKGNLNYLPGTSKAVYELIKYYKIPVIGKKVVVIGRSLNVGLPIALMMLKLDGLVSILHSKVSSKELALKVKEADIVISCTGRRGLLKDEDFTKEQIVIDCGYLEDGLGDLGFTPDVKEFAPVPKGVGPITIVSVIENALKLAFNL